MGRRGALGWLKGRCRHSTGAGRTMEWRRAWPPCAHFIFSPSANFIFLNHLLRRKLLHCGTYFEGEGNNIILGGEWWVLYKKRKMRVARGRLTVCLPACMYVYICTYRLTRICIFNAYTRIHTHTHTCRQCIKSTSVRVGICIAYIFTCTISRCV